MTEYFIVKNWKEFQHYKDRNPPWIKLHYEILASETWVMLADASRVLLTACMLVASRNEGRVPNNPDYIKRVAYLNTRPNFKPLIDVGFLEIPLADDSGCKQMLTDARPETETYSEYSKETEGEGTAPKVSKMGFNELPPEWKTWTVADRGWSEDIISDTWQLFRAHWQTGKGKNTKREDWFLTWRTWCRKENYKTPNKFQKPQDPRGGVRVL